MSKGQLPPPPTIALNRPMSYWIDLADSIADDTVHIRHRFRSLPVDDDKPADNYGMRARATRDPGTRNEIDPDRFQIHSELATRL